MPLICPKCHFEDHRQKNLGRRVGGTIGAIAGAASGAAGILSAARLGLVVGAPTGPVGAILTAIASATLRGIIGATLGCEVGSALGGLLDRQVLESNACRNCGHSFAPHFATEEPSSSPAMPSESFFGMGTSIWRKSHTETDEPDADDLAPAGPPGLS